MRTYNKRRWYHLFSKFEIEQWFILFLTIISRVSLQKQYPRALDIAAIIPFSKDFKNNAILCLIWVLNTNKIYDCLLWSPILDHDDLHEAA